MLLARFKGRALRLCVRLGIVNSVLAVVFAIVSSSGSGRRTVAAFVVLAGWTTADACRRHWVPNVLIDRRYVFGAACFSVIPFAIDGHAEANVFLALAPLAGVAAVVCRRRDVVVFTALWILSYVAGAALGGGVDVLVEERQALDAAQQVVGILASAGLFAAAVVGFRRFIDRIPPLLEGGDGTGHRIEGAHSRPGVGAVRKSHRIGEPLTKREEEILGLLTVGKSRDEVARELFVSRHTVKTHVDHILEKFDASCLQEAIALWIKGGGRA